jgi:hypothetical protein
MAGGGGGGGYYPPPGPKTGGGGGVGNDACDLRITTVINGPNPSLTGSLSVGSVLDVRVGGPSGRTIEVRLPGTTLAVGSVIGIAGAGQLLKCIDDGHGYEAKVIGIASGKIDIEVYRTATP